MWNWACVRRHWRVDPAEAHFQELGTIDSPRSIQVKGRFEDFLLAQGKLDNRYDNSLILRYSRIIFGCRADGGPGGYIRNRSKSFTSFLM